MNGFSIPIILFICAMMFLAGFIDSIAGGGGLISLPALMAIGLDPHFAMGTNKFSATFGTSIAAYKYTKSKHVHLKSALFAIIGSFIGAFGGTNLVLLIDQDIVKKIFVAVLPIVAIIVLTNKNLGENNEHHTIEEKKARLLALLIGIVVGFYDGFIGPGTGTFFTILFATVLKFDLITASGNSKLANLASNVASVTLFLFKKQVIFALAIPAAISNILGNYVGSHLAMSKGSKIIRPLLVVVLILLMITLATQAFNIKLPFLSS